MVENIITERTERMIKSKIKIIIATVLFFFISGSCFSQIDKETQLILDETKNEVEKYLDSSNYYFDLVISEHKKGVDNATLIRKYGNTIDFLERHINDLLDNVNRLGLSGYLTQKQADDWLQGIDISAKQKAKLEKIKRFGIDFSEVPVTHYYLLSQFYRDSLNNFSVQLPVGWTPVPNYTKFTLTTRGQVLIDSITGLTSDAVFMVDVNENTNGFTTEQYYFGNLKNIKKVAGNAFKILTEKDININGIPAKYVAYEVTNKGVTLASVQIYFTQNNKSYILSGSGSVYYWDTLKFLYAEISRTFKIE